MALGAETLGAFLLGGVVNALVLTPPTYWGVRALMQRRRARQAARAARKGARV